MKKFIFVLICLLSIGSLVSAAPLVVNVNDITLFQSGSHVLSYTAIRQSNTTVVNCTLLDNIAGAFGRDTSVAVDSSITNGTNTFTINPSWPSVGTTKLYDVKCVSNYTKVYKDATNATITFNVYNQAYTTSDLNSLVVDILGTGVNATISWTDLLVLLVVVGVVVSILAGLAFKAGKIFGL